MAKFISVCEVTGLLEMRIPDGRPQVTVRVRLGETVLSNMVILDVCYDISYKESYVRG